MPLATYTEPQTNCPSCKAEFESLLHESTDSRGAVISCELCSHEWREPSAIYCSRCGEMVDNGTASPHDGQWYGECCYLKRNTPYTAPAPKPMAKLLSERLLDAIRDSHDLHRTLRGTEASRNMSKGFAMGVRAVTERLKKLVADVRHFEKTDKVVAACSDDIVATVVNRLKYHRQARAVLRVEGEDSHAVELLIEELEAVLAGKTEEFRL